MGIKCGHGQSSYLTLNNIVRYLLGLILLSHFCCNSVWAAPEGEREEIGSELTNQEQENSLEYLTQFGYIKDEPGALRSIDEYTEGLKRLQAMAQIPQTGRLDRATRDTMDQPRCGVADGPAGGNGRPENFETGPSKWEKEYITYRLPRDRMTNRLSLDTVRREIRGAMDLWQRVSKLRFQEVDPPEQRPERNPQVDIDVSFERGNHGDGSAFDGQGKVLAHAFSPGGGRGGDVHFDDDERWTSRTADGTNLLIVAAHELGHSLGLSHSREKGSLMFPWYAGYTENYQLHSDDIMGIQYLYGSPENRPPTTTPRMETMRPSVTTRPLSSGVRDGPDTCGKLDSVALIRAKVFAFSGQWFWWMTEEGMIERGPYKLNQYWDGLPSNVQKIDAVFERPENNRIVFFSGDRYYEFDGNKIRPDFKNNGKPLTDMGIPRDIKKIDAAMVWGYNRRVYLFSGDLYWKVSMWNSHLYVEMGYPVSVKGVWKGLSFPIDAAFTNRRGQTFFFKDRDYWMSNNQLEPERGYPKKIKDLWQHCKNSQFTAPRNNANLNIASHWSIMTSLFTSVLFLAVSYVLNIRQNIPG